MIDFHRVANLILKLLSHDYATPTLTAGYNYVIVDLAINPNPDYLKAGIHLLSDLSLFPHICSHICMSFRLRNCQVYGA